MSSSLDEGDQVPADGQLLSAAGLRVDQSALTGEAHPGLQASCAVATSARQRAPPGAPRARLRRHRRSWPGRGASSCTATGMPTEIGGIAQLTQAVARDTEPAPARDGARHPASSPCSPPLSATGFFALGVGDVASSRSPRGSSSPSASSSPSPGGPAPDAHPGAGARCPAHGPPAEPRQAPVRRGDARGDHGDLHGQDRHAHPEPHGRSVVWTSAGARSAVDTARDPERAPDLRELFEAADPRLPGHARARRSHRGRAGGRGRSSRRRSREAPGGAPTARSVPVRLVSQADDARPRRAGSGPTAYVKGAPRETLALC